MTVKELKELGFDVSNLNEEQIMIILKEDELFDEMLYAEQKMLLVERRYYGQPDWMEKLDPHCDNWNDKKREWLVYRKKMLDFLQKNNENVNFE